MYYNCKFVTSLIQAQHKIFMFNKDFRFSFNLNDIFYNKYMNYIG